MDSNNTSPAPRYTASIAYSAETIRRLSQVQYNSFRLKTKLGLMLLGAALVLTGLFAGLARTASTIFIAIGSILLVSADFPARSRSAALINQYRNGFPHLSYTFSETGLRSDQMEEEQPYGGLILLLADASFYYLFINSLSAFMIEKSSISGEGGEDGFKAFVSEKSKLRWARPVTLLNLSLKRVKELRASIRKES